MSKEDVRDNSFGVTSVVFGVLSIAFSITILLGFIFGILSLVFAFMQRKRHNNKWATTGIVLSVVGIVLSIIIIYALTSFVSNLQETITACASNPSLPGCEQFSQYLQQQNVQYTP